MHLQLKSSPLISTRVGDREDSRKSTEWCRDHGRRPIAIMSIATMDAVEIDSPFALSVCIAIPSKYNNVTHVD
jgi:hypothetical protein